MAQRRWLAPLIGIALGIAVALLVVRFFPHGKPAVDPAAKKDPPALAGALLPEDSGALDTVLVHYVPRFEPLIDRPYRDFLGTLDPSTKLVVVIPSASATDGGGAAEIDARPALHRFLGRIDPTGALEARVTVVQAHGPMSVWSKDRALVMQGQGEERTGLLIPLPPDPKWTERANDWRTLAAVAAQQPERYYVRELPIAFDAGDFAVTNDEVLVDINLFTRNASHGLASPAALKELLGKLFARPIVMLGAQDGDVPRHHMSMYMTPLGDKQVLVGDPSLAKDVVGAAYVPGEPSPDTGEPLRADFSPEVQARYERAAKDLAAAGFDVVRVPTVAFDDKTYFAYTNGVYEVRGGKKIAWVPQYAKDDADLPVAKLDALARATYERLGWTVHPVGVRAAYPYHGTIGCLANVLARSL